MIKKISDWIYLKYGVRVKRRHIIMIIALILSILLLLFALATRSVKNTSSEIGPAVIAPAN